MAWGSRVGVQDLVDKLNRNSIQALYVLPTRTVGDAEARALAAALSKNTSATTFYSSGHALSKDAIDAMCDMLKVNRTLRNLCIGDESLGDTGLAPLCEALQMNGTVTRWDLERKGLTAEGTTALSSLLESPDCALTTLNLARNRLDDTALERLCSAFSKNDTLREVDLSENAFSSASLPALEGWLTSSTCRLEKIALRGNDLSDGSDVLGRALGRNASLMRVDVNKCRLTSAFPMAWSTIRKGHATLVELEINQNEMGKDGAAAIAELLPGMPALRRLSLSGNALEDAGAASLSSALQTPTVLLKFLDLSSNALTHESMRLLLTPSNLTELRLFHNALGSGSERLREALANSTLKLLDLGANELQGDFAVHVFDALRENDALETLEMGANRLQASGLAAMEMLKSARPSLDIAIDKKAPGEFKE